MYINVTKIVAIVACIVGGALGVLGVITMVLSKSAEEQVAGVVTAQLGLLLAWFGIWLYSRDRIK